MQSFRARVLANIILCTQTVYLFTEKSADGGGDGDGDNYDDDDDYGDDDDDDDGDDDTYATRYCGAWPFNAL